MRTVPVLAALLVLVALGALAPVAATAPTADEGISEPTVHAESTIDLESSEQANDRPVHACAAEPPEDFSDPEENVIGWSNGYWYNEPIDIDQEDGLTESELDTLIARTEARFEALRCLQAEETPPVELQSREAFIEEQSELFAGVNGTERQFDNAMFETMLMIGSEEDSIDVREANRGASVLGYYDPVGERIVVISEGNETLQMDELTLAHELGHAIQDSQFDLLRFNSQLRDESNAEDGLVEGDVHLIEHRYQQRCERGEWDCEEVPQTGDDGGIDLANYGLYLMNFQPYSDGTTFTEAVYERGGWDTVNDAYENPPTTSKHVIEPETYPEFEPANVTVDADPDEEWERIEPPGSPNYERIGQASMSAMFMGPTLETNGREGVLELQTIYNLDENNEINSQDPLNYDLDATSGWTGDRFVAYSRADNATATAWTIEWESEADAEAFVETYEELIAYRGGQPVEDRGATYQFGTDSEFDGTLSVVHDGTTTTVLKAPTVDDIIALNADAAPEIEQDEPDDTTDTTSTDDGPEEEPETGNETQNGETDEVPGFGLAAALVALIVSAGALLRRRS